MNSTAFVISIVTCCAALIVCHSICAGEQPLNVGSGKQVFADGSLISKSCGVSLRMNPPRKTGERCIVADKPWESHRVCAYNTVMGTAASTRCGMTQ